MVGRCIALSCRGSGRARRWHAARGTVVRRLVPGWRRRGASAPWVGPTPSTWRPTCSAAPLAAAVGAPVGSRKPSVSCRRIRRRGRVSPSASRHGSFGHERLISKPNPWLLCHVRSFTRSSRVGAFSFSSRWLNGGEGWRWGPGFPTRRSLRVGGAVSQRTRFRWRSALPNAGCGSAIGCADARPSASSVAFAPYRLNPT